MTQRYVLFRTQANTPRLVKIRVVAFGQFKRSGSWDIELDTLNLASTLFESWRRAVVRCSTQSTWKENRTGRMYLGSARLRAS